MPMIIDSHQHFWELAQPFNYDWLKQPALAPICCDYLPEHLAPQLAAAGVNKSIFVQTQHDLAENRWALALAEKHEFLAGVVGWVDLANPRCEEQLAELIEHPKFVGVRHVTHDEPDDDFILRSDVLRGLRVLQQHDVPFDLLFYVKHLPHAATLARQLPDLRLIIDHLAKPRIKAGAADDWLPHFQAAAEFPNVCCKLSGLITEADWSYWTPADLRPYVQTALEVFGPQRCMFGSDWPVCELAGTYEQTHQALHAALGPLSSSERAAIFGGTAAEWYGIAADEERLEGAESRVF